MAAMASADIQIVNISNLSKIEAFLNDSAYRELLESSENYNTRLCIERRLRMPFLDQQTGVAQTHCALFMKRRNRMPGIREGQIYTYPSAKWRKSKRQYLLHHHRPFRMVREPDTDSIPGLDRSSFGTVDSESKDSHTDAKEWFYDDESNLHDMMDPFEDRGDSDFDYEDNHYKKKRRSRKTPGELVPNRRGGRGGRGSRGGRRNNKGECDTPRSTARRGGRQVGASGSSLPSSNNSPLNANEDSQSAPFMFGMEQTPLQPTTVAVNANPSLGNPMSSMTSLTTLGGSTSSSATSGGSQDEEDERLRIIRKPNERTKAPPSPYCDFCLGDSRENRKTNVPEDLVSCSDCGRSGHPSCLQFTPNMIISVKRYRWQCIECKYCSICGTSDNDDQLLFCDDCDRGYHMYCLTPPLTTPPEGLWSCNICNKEFHSGK